MAAGLARLTAYSWGVFGRDKSSEAQSAVQEHPTRPGAKNRPTPKRRDQEAANRKPLVQTDRKAARAAARDARRQAVGQQRAALVTGDERHLPLRDQGKPRRYIRDFVDARFSLGEFLLPAMIVVLVLSFVKTTWALTIAFLLVYALIIAAVLDSFFMWRKLKRQLIEKFGEDELPRGSAFYAIMRAFQLRRLRMPKPLVARGEYPS